LRNLSQHHQSRIASEPCRERTCCVQGPAKRASGVPLCAAVCVCVLCAPSAWAQDVSSSPAPDRPSEARQPRAEAPPAVSPPRVLESVEATYPPDALAARREARVELLVSVLADGTVGEVEVTRSGTQELDAAAVAAVRQWRFEPARRGEQAVDTRIRVPFRFALPEPAAPPSGSVSEAPQTPTDESEPASTSEAPVEVTVRAERALRAEDRSVSDFQIARDVLAAAPRQEGADVLRSAPGVYIGRAEGPAVAHNYMLRGFDADHGQDIEFRVGGLPINIPSHIHGQGYSDLGFVIGDTVRELRVTEGVYDPRQGDFAVAGSIDLTLGVEERERGVRLSSGYGSFNTFRQVILWAPPEASEESFGAVQYMRTDGFGENRAGQSGSGIFQRRFGDGDVTFRAIGILHAARSDLAGVVRQDDVDRGRLCFTCVYPYPTAQAQNALANRFLAGFFADYAGNDGDNGQLGLWLGYDNFRLQENWTGFLQESRVLERVGGRGDLIEQQNRTLSLGLTGRHRTSPYRLAPRARGTIEVGADGRIDVMDQAQNLLDASVRNQTWDRRVDASMRGVDLGVWGDLDGTFTQYLRVRAGLRADVLSYDIEDRLGNFAPLTRPQNNFIPGFRRSALGLAWGPRTSVEVRPLQWLAILAAYGEGYRSPQARLLEDGEETPFSKVRSADFGVRFDLGDPLRLTVGGYYTHLSDDVAFDAGEGRLERIGATERIGAVLHAVTRPMPGWVGSLSFTFVDATLLQPPPPTAEEPQPAFSEGQNLPFVPPIVVRADLGAHQTFIEGLAGRSLDGRTGLGFSFLSPRPLPYGAFADPVALLDASAALSWGPIELAFELFNALSSTYAAVEYSFPSDWEPNDGVRPRTPARHTAAGAPLSYLLSLRVTL
jgi:iron complex outermembrane recepter protein